MNLQQWSFAILVAVGALEAMGCGSGGGGLNPIPTPVIGLP